MAFDAAQILRQTYAAGADAAMMRELAEPVRTAPALERGEMMGMAQMKRVVFTDNGADFHSFSCCDSAGFLI